jgi:hypothetical protein
VTLSRRGLVLAALVAVVAGAAAADTGPLVRSAGGAEIDWAAGVIRAQAGSAADYRLPSAEIARAGAERRARAAASAELRTALQGVALGAGRRLSAAEIDAALARVRTVDVDYQSNGGAVVTMSLRFAEVTGASSEQAEAAPPRRVLSVPAMPLELAPRVAAGDDQGTLAWAVYRVGTAPADADALTVRRDRDGRLVLPRADRRLIEKLAHQPAVIYVQKIVK